MSQNDDNWAVLMEIHGRESVGRKVAAFLRIYAGIIRKNERWDTPETMARSFETAALQLEISEKVLVEPPVWRSENDPAYEPPRCDGIPSMDWTRLHPAIRCVDIHWWDAFGARSVLIQRRSGRVHA